MQLSGAYQRLGLFVDRDVTEALKQAISTKGSLIEVSLSETKDGGVLTLSTIISPDYSKSFDDYKNAVISADGVPSVEKIATTSELNADSDWDDLDDCDFELSLNEWYW
ncbi:hypothetical protein [Fusibacter ferrireducens]|uniref:Uncharacterized protein n=1 Tax=Fusibacter ferrireducens TaxID=2785058 RepID=A0ABR9ZX91_9FIRM|nr:hypothetical protein [Fusibacter ferrireducens]MBF4695083.1 hypothetical protein [Fusibacter ferrireducens]